MIYLQMIGFVLAAGFVGGIIVLVQGAIVHVVGNWLEPRVGTSVTVVTILVLITCEVTALFRYLGLLPDRMHLW